MTKNLAMVAGAALFLALPAHAVPAERPEVPGSSARDPKDLPNVLFIAVDDLNCSLGSYGHGVVKSPNLDRLAARGVRFDRAYCQYPLCNPSRTSFLSGKRPEATRVFDNQTPPRTHLKELEFLPEHLRRHGYFTARVGKILHGRFEGACSWDEGGAPAPRAALSPEERARKQEQKAARKAKQESKGEKKAGEAEDSPAVPLAARATEKGDEEEPDGRAARRVVELLEKHRDRPFFIALGLHKPHLPFVAPKRYFDLYPPEKIVLPDEPADDRADIPRIAIAYGDRDARTPPEERRRLTAGYFACVSFMDAQVGLVLDTLERLKLAEKTVVVFFGDHGFHLGEHGGMWRKLSLFEESARVPLIVAAPGKRAGAVSPRLVELVDLYPTILDLCGLPAPAGLEGTSFAPLLEDPSRPWKKAAFSVVQRGKTLGRSARSERYRYTEWDDAGTAELYDHQTDPREHRNLVGDPAHAEALAELRRLLREGWRAATPPQPANARN